MTYTIRRFDSYEVLPDNYDELLGVANEQGFFSRREWFEFLMNNIHSNGQAMRLYAVEDSTSGTPLLLAPLRYTRVDAAVYKAHTLASIGHLENYAPACFLVAPGSAQKRRELLTALFSWLRAPQQGELPKRIDVIRLWPFAVPSQLGEDALWALSDAGFAVQTYANSYNQYEEVAGLSYAEYFEKRSSNQRYNSRRRRRNLEKEGELEFSMYTCDDKQEEYRAAVDDYILVSVHSWKPLASTVASSMLELIDMAAKQGCLRLGILRLNGKPIAAQFWLCSGGVASMMRPNYHEQYKKFAPGVVLTNFIIEYLLNVDHANALDLGYGNDEYKGKWVNASRNYSGIMAFNPSTPRGFYFGAKHIFGRSVKRFLRRGQSILDSRGVE